MESIVTLPRFGNQVLGWNYQHFEEDTTYYFNSEACCKMLMMAVMLYEDYGVPYSLKPITSPEATAADESSHHRVVNTSK